MNSLEFIEKEIKITQKSYSAFDLDYMLFGGESDKKEAEKLLKKLKHLQQIKSELEAWEVVKKYVKEQSINGIVFDHIINVSHTKQNYEIVKKALEVKENVD